MQYFVSLIFPIISYFLQIYPRFSNRYFGVDVWTLLLEIDLIKKNNHRIPKEKIKNGFIIDGYFDYPPFFLMLLSFLPKKFLYQNQGFVSPLFDALLNICIFFIVYSLSNNLTLALLSQFIYLLTPVAALENSALLPRSLGYTFFMLSFYFLILFTSGGSQQIILLLTAIFLASLTLLTHKFATQSYLFIAIFFTLFEKNIIYVSALFAGFIIAVIISKGYYLKVLNSHIGIISFWIKNRAYRFAHQIYGNIAIKKNPDLIGIIYKLLIKLAPLTMLASNPWVMSAFLFLYTQPLSFHPVLFKMMVWILFFYAFGVLVLMIPRLTPIGEGYRYMEMTTLPSAILASYMVYYFINSIHGVLTLVLFSLIALGTFLVIIFIQNKAVVNDNNRSLTNSMIDVFKFINKLPNKPRIMCIPHQITTMTVYNTNADVLVNFDVDGLFKMEDFYPILKKPLYKILNHYNIQYILLRESFAKLSDLKIDNYKLIYRSEDISLLKLK